MAPKKNKGQKMGIGDFLQDASLGATSWADEMEDMPLPVPASSSRYGTGDRGYGSSNAFGSSSSYADRGYSTRPQIGLPDKPPFTVHLGNLSFDATQRDLQDFFHDCDVDNVRIVEDRADSKPKGFGYAEFKTRSGIEKAMAKDGAQFQGRNIRISPAEPRKSENLILQCSSAGSTADVLLPERDRPGAREISDWSRKGPLPDLPRQGSRQGSDRGDRSDRVDRAPFAFSGDPRGQRFEPSTSSSFSTAGSERGGSRRNYEPSGADAGRMRDLGNWERKGPSAPTKASPSTSANSAPPKSFDRSVSREGSGLQHRTPTWGEGTNPAQDPMGTSRPPRRDFSERAPPVERPPTAAEQDSQWRARMRPDAPVPSPSQVPAAEPAMRPAKSLAQEPNLPSSAVPAAPTIPATRPKLNLAKRTVSEAPSADAASAVSSGTDSKANPFGAAQPVDTASKDREVEVKRQQALKEKKEAEEKAREEKRVAEEKAKEEKTKARDAELAERSTRKNDAPTVAGNNEKGGKYISRPNASSDARATSGSQPNGSPRRILPRRDRSDNQNEGQKPHTLRNRNSNHSGTIHSTNSDAPKDNNRRHERGDKMSGGPGGGAQAVKPQAPLSSAPQYDILRQHAEEAASAADEEAEDLADIDKTQNANGIVADDKETKPQLLVAGTSSNGGTPTDDRAASGNKNSGESTADALQDDGWNVVTKSARKGKNGNQAARALAS